jgi:hypothetical protein
MIKNAYLLKKNWLLPLIFFESYLSVVLLLFYFGPWPWPIENPISTFLFLIFSQIFICVGYLFSWKKINQLHQTNICPQHFASKRLKFLKFSIALSLFIFIPSSLSRTGNLLPNILDAINNSGLSYNMNIERLQSQNSYVFVEYIRMFISPFLFSVLPLTIVCWRYLSVSLKFLSLIVILLNTSIYISTGVNKGIFDVILTFPWFFYLAKTTEPLENKLSRMKIILLTISLLFLFSLALIFFGEGQLGRDGGVAQNAVFKTSIGLINAEETSGLSLFLSDKQIIIFQSLARYLTQGYYALSISFNIEHVSTLGFGNSIFMSRNMDSLFKTDFFMSNSIPGLLEQADGYNMLGLWHSIYPWLASDFGFVGTLILIGWFAYLLGLIWGRSLLTLSPQNLVFLYLLLILFFYIPANNQIFQSGESCLAFFILIFFQRNYFKRKQKI